MKTEKWSFHFWNGLINQYPLCCVLFFCNGWLSHGLQKDGIFDMICDTDDESWIKGDYVKCPQCVVERLS